jgi:hypothetical protein
MMDDKNVGESKQDVESGDVLDYGSSVTVDIPDDNDALCHASG